MADFLKKYREKQELVKEFGFKTMDDFRINFIDRGDYIELTKPVGDISMIQKYPSEFTMALDDAVKYSAKLKLGGIDGWRLPTIEDIEILHKIYNVCRIKGKMAGVWVSPWNAKEPYCAVLSTGELYTPYFKTGYVRCVR